MRILWKVPCIDLTWPSVRIRTLSPALSLRTRGHEVSVREARPSVEEIGWSQAVVINKSFTADDLWLADRAKAMGKPLVIDICDDIGAVDRPDDLRSFLQQIAGADCVVTTGDELACRIRALGGTTAPVEVIGDGAEDRQSLARLAEAFPPRTVKEWHRVFGEGLRRRLLARLSGREPRLSTKRRTVIWFGMPGQKEDGVGLTTLPLVAQALNAVNQTIPLQLLVVTRGHAAFREATQSFSVPCIFRQWALLPACDLIAGSDVAILPNPDSAFARGKSPNRALLALSCGTPVIASALPAFEPLAGAVVLDDWEGGLRRYLGDRDAAERDVVAGQALIQANFDADSICSRWEFLLSELSTSRTRRQAASA